MPDDIVQPEGTSTVVNLTAMEAWLANFDYPVIISSGSAAALEVDESYGTASFIYSFAVAQAAPAGSPDDDEWKLVGAEISAAQQNLVPAADQNLTCMPDDWVLPSATGYWTTFNFSQTSSSSSSTAATVRVPIVDTRFWMVRSLAVAPPASAPPASAPPASTTTTTTTANRAQLEVPGPALRMEAAPRPSPMMEAVRIAPQSSSSSSSAPAQSVDNVRFRAPITLGLLPERLNANALFAGAAPVDQVTTSTSSTITVTLDHQLVTLDRYSGGQSWWDGLFLANQGWYIPGMTRGGLLPAPSDAVDGATYGLPIALIVVQNLTVSGQWSQAAITALTSPGGSIGPLSLLGATGTTAKDGVTVTFAAPGMQVVALLCSPLSVLPPVDASAAPSWSASSDSSSSSSSSLSTSSLSSSSLSSSSLSSSSLSSSSSSPSLSSSSSVASSSAMSSASATSSSST